jgi:hypothetical protein
MDVRVVHIPVIDSDPIKAGAEVPLGLRHQVPGKRFEIGELLRVLWRHDEPEMMPVTFAAHGKGAVVGIILTGIKHPARSAVLRDAFPPQIGDVSAEQRSPRPVPYNARFDGNAARPGRHQPRHRDARGPAAAETSATAATPGSTPQSTGLLGCRQRPRNERLAAARVAPAPVPDAPKPDMEIIVVDHSVHEVRAVVTLQGVVRIGSLSFAGAPRARCLMCLNFSAARPSRSLRLLSCLRAVGSPAPCGLTVESATTSEIPRRRAKRLISASAPTISAQRDYRLVPCLFPALQLQH